MDSCDGIKEVFLHKRFQEKCKQLPKDRPGIVVIFSSLLHLGRIVSNYQTLVDLREWKDKKILKNLRSILRVRNFFFLSKNRQTESLQLLLQAPFVPPKSLAVENKHDIKKVAKVLNRTEEALQARYPHKKC